MFLSELAATATTSGEHRVGVDISRFAGNLLVAFEQCGKSWPTRWSIIDKQLNAALVEVARLEPHLAVLNAGKGSEQQEEKTMSSFNKVRAKAARSSTRGDAAPSQETLAEAAKVLHGWLDGADTPLRAVLAVLGAHRCFHAAARAWVKTKPASEGDAVSAAQARSSGAASSSLQARAHDDEANGLID